MKKSLLRVPKIRGNLSYSQNISSGCFNPHFQLLQGAGKLLVLVYLFCPNINLHVLCVRKYAGDCSVSGNTKSDHIFKLSLLLCNCQLQIFLLDFFN